MQNNCDIYKILCKCGLSYIVVVSHTVKMYDRYIKYQNQKSWFIAKKSWFIGKLVGFLPIVLISSFEGKYLKMSCYSKILFLGSLLQQKL